MGACSDRVQVNFMGDNQPSDFVPNAVELLGCCGMYTHLVKCKVSHHTSYIILCCTDGGKILGDSLASSGKHHSSSDQTSSLPASMRADVNIFT